MIRIVLKANPDILHANSFYAGAVALPAAIITRRKLIVHARDLADFGFLSRFYNWFCRKVIAVSRSVRNALVDQGINSDRIEVIYNGVDDCSLDGPKERGSSCTLSYPDQGRAFVFGNVGQFVPWKKQIVFLEAASRVARDANNVGFVLVGDDILGRDSGYKRTVLNHAEHSEIAEKVSFLGWQDNMCEVWPKIDCLVHTADREPFGRVIVEAMAHRIPVIAVGACGPGEIIENDKTGLLVQKDDIGELSEGMLRIIRNRDFADRLANAGYEHVMANFTANKTAEQIRRVYEDALAV
jgi:glycosyltransferase involved in cell wall biosynthesis